MAVLLIFRDPLLIFSLCTELFCAAYVSKTFRAWIKSGKRAIYMENTGIL